MTEITAKFKEVILIHKKTAEVVLLLENSFFSSEILQYSDWPNDKPMFPNGPFLFNVDKRFNLSQYEVLGEL